MIKKYKRKINIIMTGNLKKLKEKSRKKLKILENKENKVNFIFIVKNLNKEFLLQNMSNN